jgi:hypothetical protein
MLQKHAGEKAAEFSVTDIFKNVRMRDSYKG